MTTPDSAVEACLFCGHQHSGPELAGICIGCPCPSVPTRPGWTVYEPSLGDPNVQIVPDQDLLDHDFEGFDCVCGPTVDFSEGMPMVTHHSLDARERTDQKGT